MRDPHQSRPTTTKPGSPGLQRTQTRVSQGTSAPTISMQTDLKGHETSIPVDMVLEQLMYCRR